MLDTFLDMALAEDLQTQFLVEAPGEVFEDMITTLVRDFPAESARFVVEAEGYATVIVNGQRLFEDGVRTGALSGHLLR